MSLLIRLVWKLKQHLLGMAGAPGGTARAQLSLEAPSSLPTPLHEASPPPCTPSLFSGVPVLSPSPVPRVAVLTLGQALVAKCDEEEEDAEGPGCLGHAGLQEGCGLLRAPSCLGWGCFYGAASSGTSSCVDRGRTWFLAMSQSTEGGRFPSSPKEEKLLPEPNGVGIFQTPASGIGTNGWVAPRVWLHTPIPRRVAGHIGQDGV